MVALLAALSRPFTVVILNVSGHRLRDAPANVTNLALREHCRPAHSEARGDRVAERDVPQVADMQSLSRVRIAEVDENPSFREEVSGPNRPAVAGLEHLPKITDALIRQADAHSLSLTDRHGSNGLEPCDLT